MMNKETINIGIIIRMATSLIPLFLGMPTIATILCAYNIAMSFVVLGPVNSIFSGIGAVIISALFGGIMMQGGETYGLVIGIEAVLCASGVIYSIVKKTGFFRGVWLASAGYLVPSFVYTYISATKSGQSVVSYLVSEPVKMLSEGIKPVLESTATGAIELEEIIEIVQKVSTMIIPSVFIISSIFVGYVTMWSVNTALKKAPFGYKHSFASLKMPKSAVSILIVVFVLNLFVDSNLEYIFTNMFVILSGMCFFSGLSLVEHLLRRKFKNLFVRIIIHFVIYAILSVLIPFLPYILIGVIDSFADFRKITRKKKEDAAVETEK